MKRSGNGIGAVLSGIGAGVGFGRGGALASSFGLGGTNDPSLVPMWDATSGLDVLASGSNGSVAPNVQGFWDTMADFGTVTPMVGDAAEPWRTVVDLTGHGFLFHVIAPVVNLNNTMGLRITLDDNVFEKVSSGPWNAYPGDGRICWGALGVKSDRFTSTSNGGGLSMHYGILKDTSVVDGIPRPATATAELAAMETISLLHLPHGVFRNHMKVEIKTYGANGIAGNAAATYYRKGDPLDA